MKKLTMITLTCLLGLALAACSNGDNTTASTSTASTEIASTDTSTGDENMKTVFTGVIQEDATESDDQSVRIFLKEVKGIEDEGNVVPTLQPDGVILNVPKEALSVPVAELIKDQRVQVTLEGLPITTMSIPPQIPGRSIKQVELLE